jgi:hypothetical protein
MAQLDLATRIRNAVANSGKRKKNDNLKVLADFDVGVLKDHEINLAAKYILHQIEMGEHDYCRCVNQNCVVGPRKPFGGEVYAFDLRTCANQDYLLDEIQWRRKGSNKELRDKLLASYDEVKSPNPQFFRRIYKTESTSLALVLYIGDETSIPPALPHGNSVIKTSPYFPKSSVSFNTTF